ncbi:TPA: hypothetical protein EYP75_00270 [Candidatus Bathyarchaeota archaeon]|nr:hypothetical protein [Candidatus Bathyarchaeota archaeon]
MASSKPSFKELMEKGDIVEVTSVGTICGLDEYEYCAYGRCQYWDEKKRQCKRFVWASVMYEEKYYTLVMSREKAKENVKIARFLKQP